MVTHFYNTQGYSLIYTSSYGGLTVGTLTPRAAVSMASNKSFTELTVQEVEDYLEGKGVGDDVIANFRRNRVTGAAFLRLTEEDLRELVPLIGERTDVREILKRIKQVCHISPVLLSVHVYVHASALLLPVKLTSIFATRILTEMTRRLVPVLGVVLRRYVLLSSRTRVVYFVHLRSIGTNHNYAQLGWRVVRLALII